MVVGKWFQRARGVLGGVMALLLGFGASASVAEARRCGGDVPCGCGDTLRGETQLTRDLLDCEDDGLRLKGGAVLDCRGHQITGRSRSEGVLLDEAVGAVVRDCRIVGFETGIRIRGGSDNQVSGNEVVSSRRYGVELARGSTGNWIEANLVTGSGDEGIHVGTGADGNAVVGNEIHGSGDENLYVLSSEGGVFAGNLLTSSGAAAVYLKHSSNNLFTANEVRGHVVHVRGHSTENLFERNRVEEGRFVFDAYKDREHPASVKGWTRPTENRVVGGAVFDTRKCFQFKGVTDNHVEGVRANGCKARTQSKKGGVKSKRNGVSLVP